MRYYTFNSSGCGLTFRSNFRALFSLRGSWAHFIDVLLHVLEMIIQCFLVNHIDLCRLEDFSMPHLMRVKNLGSLDSFNLIIRPPSADFCLAYILSLRYLLLPDSQLMILIREYGFKIIVIKFPILRGWWTFWWYTLQERGRWLISSTATSHHLSLLHV